MKAVLQKEQEEPVQEFIVLNEYCQVFCGFSKGYPAFSDDMESARNLTKPRSIQKCTIRNIP
jgi:hypothetical protein